MSKIKQLVPEAVNEFDELDYDNTNGISSQSQERLDNDAEAI